MFTTTKPAISQSVSEWVKVFPAQATENYTSSVTFMKQLTVVAISTITYLKDIFPEDSYITETFNGLKMMILKSKCRDELANFLSTSLTQSFEAFDKRYLHKLALCFYKDECRIENLIEYYIFEYSYKRDGVTMSVQSKNQDTEKHAEYSFEKLREQTINMIKTCVVMAQANQGDSPAILDVTMMLYYNEDSPSDYQAPGFQALVDEEEDHLKATLGDTFSLGRVATPYHKLVIRSYIRSSEIPASNVAMASQSLPSISEVDQILEDLPDVSPAPCKSTSPLVLQCPCHMLNDDSSQSSLLKCQHCNTWQHAACYGMRGVGGTGYLGEVKTHCCVRCYDEDSTRHLTDSWLASLAVEKRTALCKVRRTLDWCAQISTVSAEELCYKFHISEYTATKIMKLLYSYKIITRYPEDLNTPQKIVAENLKQAMVKFFQNFENDIVERVLNEAFASQESRPDPITESLNRLEKVSLQNSKIGRVVETPVKAMSDAVESEDPTLKQYRAAIFSNDGIEEPAKITQVLGKGLKKSVKRKFDDTKHNAFGMKLKDKPKRAKGDATTKI